MTDTQQVDPAWLPKAYREHAPYVEAHAALPNETLAQRLGVETATIRGIRKYFGYDNPAPEWVHKANWRRSNAEIAKSARKSVETVAKYRPVANRVYGDELAPNVNPVSVVREAA